MAIKDWLWNKVKGRYPWTFYVAQPEVLRVTHKWFSGSRGEGKLQGELTRRASTSGNCLMNSIKVINYIPRCIIYLF